MKDFEFFDRFGSHDEKLLALKPLLVGKFGMIFSNQSVFDLKAAIQSNKRKAVAKPGAVSNVEVVIPPGSTGMDPS